VTIVVLLELVLSIPYLYLGLLVAGGPDWIANVGYLVSLILGVLGLAAAYASFVGKSWGWTAGFIFSVLVIALDVLSLLSGILSALVEILLSVLTLYLLTRPQARGYFGKSALGAQAPVQPS